MIKTSEQIIYESPQITMLEMEVEKGFSSSHSEIGNETLNENEGIW